MRAASTAQTITADLAGNSAPSNVVTVKIDKTGPRRSVRRRPPSPIAMKPVQRHVTVHFTCADALSGAASRPADQGLTSEGSAALTRQLKPSAI
ncbi:MAG: hypothetical protein U0350_28625 [Caldilineaceae bacterium]